MWLLSTSKHDSVSQPRPGLPGVIPGLWDTGRDRAAAASTLFWVPGLNPSLATCRWGESIDRQFPVHPSAWFCIPQHRFASFSTHLRMAPEVPPSIWGDRAQFCPNNKIFFFHSGLLPQQRCCKESCR